MNQFPTLQSAEMFAVFLMEHKVNINGAFTFLQTN